MFSLFSSIISFGEAVSLAKAKEVKEAVNKIIGDRLRLDE